MPIYEYICHGCSREFEEIQKFSDPPLKKCAECGGKVERVVSRSSFHLKGGGWYNEGYSKEKQSKKPASSETTTSSTSTEKAKPS